MRTIGFAGALMLLALAGGCSSGGSGGGGFNGGRGSCQDFSGTYETTVTCSDGDTEFLRSELVQQGCTGTHTELKNGDQTTWQLSGNTATRQVNEDGCTGSCNVTLSGEALSGSCNLSCSGKALTCTTSGRRTSGPPSGGGSGGSPGGQWEGSSGGASGGPGEEWSGSSGGTPGSGSASGSAPDGGDCGLTWTDSASCESCMQSSCCSAIAACSPGTACYGLIECIVVDCGSQRECVESRCGSYPGWETLMNLLDCNESRCGGCT
jgi:hypothetical protein